MASAIVIDIMLKETNRGTIYGIIIFAMAMIGFDAVGQSLEKSIRYADEDKAKELLTTEDAYTNCWSAFDIDSRMQKKNSAKADLFQFIATQVREWDATEKQKIDTIFHEINIEIIRSGYRLNIPKNISMVKTTLLEEGGASAYTRGNYIVFGEKLLKKSKEDLKPVVIHELFHVLSRNDAAFREHLYALIGFQKMNEIAYPESIANARITNPDAPQTDYFITLKKGGKSMDCMMVLYANRPYEGGMFFEYLQVGFLRLDGNREKTVYLKDGKPEIYSMNEVSGFYEQVGQNTKYIIHPEEILADNFSFAILNKTDLPSQWLVENLKKSMKN